MADLASLVDTVNHRPCDEQVTINANLDAESKSLKRFTVGSYENLCKLKCRFKIARAIYSRGWLVIGDFS